MSTHKFAILLLLSVLSGTHSQIVNQNFGSDEIAGILRQYPKSTVPDFPILNCTSKDSITYIPPNSNYSLNSNFLRTLTFDVRGIGIAASIVNVREPSEEINNDVYIQVAFRLSDPKYKDQVSVVGKEARPGYFSMSVITPMGKALKTDPDTPCILVMLQITVPRKSSSSTVYPPPLFINARLVAGLVGLNLTDANINLGVLRVTLGTGLIAGYDVKASTSIYLINGAGGITGSYTGFRQFHAGTVTQGAIYVGLNVRDRNPTIINTVTKSGPVAATISENFKGRFLVQTENGSSHVFAPNPDDLKFDDDSDTPSTTAASKKSGLKTGVGVHRVTVGTGNGMAVLRFVDRTANTWDSTEYSCDKKIVSTLGGVGRRSRVEEFFGVWETFAVKGSNVFC